MSRPRSQQRYTPITNSNNSKDVTVFVGLVIGTRLDSEILLRGAFALTEKWPLLGGFIDKTTAPWSLTTGQKVDFRHRRMQTTLDQVFTLPFQNLSSMKPTYVHQHEGDDMHDKLFHFDNYRHYNAQADGLFSIRVTVLKDATLLGFRSPHYLVNASTLCEIIKAYSQVLASQTIPEMVWPPDVNVARPLSSLVAVDNRNGGSAIPSVGEDNFVTCADFCKVGVFAGLPTILSMIYALILSWFLASYAVEEKLIYIPSSLVETLRDEAQQHVDGHVTFSRLDIVSAWFLKTSFSTTPPDQDVFAYSYPIDYRSLLPAALPNTHWLKNTTYEITIRWEHFSQFKSSSLAAIATKIRTKVVACKQPFAVKESLKFLETNNAALVTPGMKGRNRFDRFPIISSWGNGYYDFDFSPAAEKSAPGETGKHTAEVLFVLPRNIFPGGLRPKGLAFVLKDEKRGYWLRATLGRNEWEGHGLQVF